MTSEEGETKSGRSMSSIAGVAVVSEEVQGIPIRGSVHQGQDQ